MGPERRQCETIGNCGKTAFSEKRAALKREGGRNKSVAGLGQGRGGVGGRVG
jgi:hypothetical protein